MKYHTSRILFVFLSLAFVALACPLLSHAGPVYLLRLDGTYAPKLNYSPGDVVTDGTNSYVDILTLIQSPNRAVSVEPGVAAGWEKYWEFLPFGGPGPQGVQGPPGPPPFTLAVRASNTSGESITTGDTLVITNWTAPDTSGTSQNFDTYLVDTGTASFNPSTGVFTAPVSGEYNISAVITFANDARIQAGYDVRLYVDTLDSTGNFLQQIRFAEYLNSGSSSYGGMSLSGSTLIYLAAGQKAELCILTNSAGPQALRNSNQDSNISIFYVAQ